jgi:Cu/Ag efflux protein CusF
MSACRQPEPTRGFPLRGQVLSVHADRQQITIKHEDIEGLMPGMTMTFPVASAELLRGREPGELIYATLELTGTEARLTKIERTGLHRFPWTPTPHRLRATCSRPETRCPMRRSSTSMIAAVQCPSGAAPWYC